MRVITLRQRIPELDGIRGLAILLVLVFHYVSQEGSRPPGSVSFLLQRLVVMGWTGVDLFFVLSGFLIGGILMEARSSPRYFRTFYARRFFRIVPIYYLWITIYILTIAVAGNWVMRLSNSGLRPPLDLGIASYFLFLQNLLPVTLFGIAGAWFGHLWSLAVEEQFYLVAPLVVRFSAAKMLKWLLLAVVVGTPLLRVLLLRIAHLPPPVVATLVATRADSLAIGFLAAALTRGETPLFSIERNLVFLRALLPVFLLGAGLLWIYSPQSFTFGMQSVGYTWMALLYVLLLMLAVGHPEGAIARVFRVGWLRELGVVSYCVYIIHIVVNVVMHAVLLHQAPHISTASGAVVTVVAAFATYGLAKISWLLLEGPLQRRGHAFKY